MHIIQCGPRAKFATDGWHEQDPFDLHTFGPGLGRKRKLSNITKHKNTLQYSRFREALNIDANRQL